jgi:hypothetical protein
VAGVAGPDAVDTVSEMAGGDDSESVDTSGGEIAEYEVAARSRADLYRARRDAAASRSCNGLAARTASRVA